MKPRIRTTIILAIWSVSLCIAFAAGRFCSAPIANWLEAAASVVMLFSVGCCLWMIRSEIRDVDTERRSLLREVERHTKGAR